MGVSITDLTRIMASAASVFMALSCLLFLLSGESVMNETEVEGMNNALETATEKVVGAPAPGEFSHYILALQWAPSICTQMGWTCRDITVPRRFTIRGLWPSNSNGEPVQNCDPDNIFDFFQIMSLDSYPNRELSTKWPTLISNLDQQKFLENEWTKHGTCSGLTQLEYFRTALKLYDTVNLYNRLANKRVGVTPSKTATYYLDTVVTRYYKKWKLYVKINCVYKSSTALMIAEIHSQVSKDGKKVVSITGDTNMCGKSEVGYPERA